VQLRSEGLINVSLMLLPTLDNSALFVLDHLVFVVQGARRLC